LTTGWNAEAFLHYVLLSSAANCRPVRFGVSPAYIEKRLQIEISAQQRKDFDDLLERSHFFKLPTRLGENAANGRGHEHIQHYR
jgi:hypothetical protein